MHPGLSRPPACREEPGRVLAAPAVRSSQAQVHVTNFDYNHHPLNTMPGTRPASRARRADPGPGSARRAGAHSTRPSTRPGSRPGEGRRDTPELNAAPLPPSGVPEACVPSGQQSWILGPELGFRCRRRAPGRQQDRPVPGDRDDRGGLRRSDRRRRGTQDRRSYRGPRYRGQDQVPAGGHIGPIRLRSPLSGTTRYIARRGGSVRTRVLRRWQGQQPRSGRVRVRSALGSGARRVLRPCRRAPRGRPWIGPVR